MAHSHNHGGSSDESAALVLTQLTVFGLDGRVLRQTRLDLSGSAPVELDNLPAGTYNLFFRSMKDGRSGVLRVLKQ